MAGGAPTSPGFLVSDSLHEVAPVLNSDARIRRDGGRLMAGAKGKYTPQTVDKIVTALSVGMTDLDACIVGGITQETFYAWKRNKSEFSERVTRAREEGWQGALAVIKHAAIKDRDWRAAGEFLDRTKSAYRKSNETVLSNGETGAPFTFKLEVVE